MRFHHRLLLLTSFCTRTSAYTMHKSFREVMNKYDAFILDQFGVMHDGTQPLDGAVELVKTLYKEGKKLIILSNTSAPSDAALKKLPKFGFDSNYFMGAVTSGEEASKYISKQFGSGSEPSKALFVTWDATDPNNPRLTALPEQFIAQCGNVQVANTKPEASFLLLHGSEGWLKGNGEFEPIGSFIEDGNMDTVDALLKECLNLGLPAVCANPDMIVRKPDGGSAHMPGKIAKRYEDLGGSVRIFGKPQKEHFEACITKLGIDKDRVAHVGDSLHHDIAGARACNIPNIFITSGIHSAELGMKFGEMPSESQLDSLFERTEGIFPTHVLSTFSL